MNMSLSLLLKRANVLSWILPRLDSLPQALKRQVEAFAREFVPLCILHEAGQACGV